MTKNFAERICSLSYHLLLDGPISCLSILINVRTTFFGFSTNDIARADISGESDISADESFTEDEESDSNSVESGGEEDWSDDLDFVIVEDFNKPTGPTTVLPATATAGDFLNLVFPEDLIQLIVDETNRNARRKQQQSGTVDKDWMPVNNSDIKAFFAIRFIQGINSLPSERHFWSKNPILGNVKVQNVMSRNRYLKINTYLHFNDSSTALPREDVNHDKLHHIRPLIDRLAETFAAQYMPSRENAIDEGLVKFKGRLGFKQYMPMKPIKRGIKVWMCADSITHFVSRFQVNTGQPRGGREHGLGEHVMTKLSSDLEHGYYNINFDNSFPSFGLMKTLLDKRINPTATTQPNQNRFPAPLKTWKLRHGKRIAMQKSGITACNWQDKKILNFFTTNCQPSGRELCKEETETAP